MEIPDRRKYDPLGRAQDYLNKPIVEPEDDLGTKSLDSFEEKEVEWLIPGWLPKGQITLICGTGGVGKTSVWISLIASFSSGDKTIFDGKEKPEKKEPAPCMFFSSEDQIETVILKRLRLNGAKMRKIRTIALEDPKFDDLQFGSEKLEALIAKHRPVLCVFDPLQAFIDKKVKMADRNAMRQNMRSLIELGAKYGTTFLIVMHTNKQQNVWGRARMADSADLWDIARSVWMVGETSDEDIKYLSHEKSNYGKTQQTLLFRNLDGQPTWQAWSDLKDKDFVLAAAQKRDEARNRQGVDEAEATILCELAEHPEGVLVSDLDSLLKAMSYSSREIRTAKNNLKSRGAIKYFKHGMNTVWNVKKA